MVKSFSSPSLRLNLPDKANGFLEQDYDVSVGLNQDTFNNVIKSVHNGVYPQYMKDSIEMKDLKLSLGWDVQESPKVAFAKSRRAYESFRMKFLMEEDVSRIKNELNALPLPHNVDIDPFEDFTAGDLANEEIFIAVTATLPKFELLLKNTANQESASATFSVDLSCLVQLNDKHEIYVLPFDFHIDKPKQVMEALFKPGIVDVTGDKHIIAGGEDDIEIDEDSFFLFLINDILVPVVLPQVANFLPKFKIPDFEYMGISLANLYLDLDEAKHIIVSAKLKDTFEGPEIAESGDQMVTAAGEGLFVALSGKFIKAAFGLIVQKLSKFSGTGKWFIVDYSYIIEPKFPSIAVDTKGNITLGIEGSADINVRLRWGWFSYPFILKLKINTDKKRPSLTFKVNAEANTKLVVNFEKFNEFEIIYDSSSTRIPTFLLNELLKYFTNFIVDIMNLFFHGFGFSLMEIPTFTFFYQNLAISAKPSEVKTETYGGNGLRLKADLNVTIANKGKGKMLVGRLNQSLSPGDYISSPSGSYYLIYQEDGDLVLYNSTNNLIWQTHTSKQNKGKEPFQARMQEDGNFVVYARNKSGQQGDALYRSDTKQKGNVQYNLVLYDDGTLDIFDDKEKRYVKHLYPEHSIHSQSLNIL